MKARKAIALFSGGLDSILASRLIMSQGIEVLAVQFVTPFFNYALLADIPAHQRKIREKYGIEVMVEDISQGYLRLLHSPQHGFGKNFNPCIDCKIMMLSRAKAMLEEQGASFIISGEVLGQRPMSQRRDTLNIIERDSGTRGLLLRPLCAQLMPVTEAEKAGLVDRSRLLAMSGRGRSAQIALAGEFGIEDFPSPAGGCTLADPILGARIERLYTTDTIVSSADFTVNDVRSLLVGRQFLLPGGGWLVVGRNDRENDRLLELAGAADILLEVEDWPSPVALLKKAGAMQDVQRESLLSLAASVVVRYSKKGPDPLIARVVTCTMGGSVRRINARPIDDALLRPWALT